MTEATLEFIFRNLFFVTYTVLGASVLSFLTALIWNRGRDPKESLANLGFWGLNQLLRVTLIGSFTIVFLKPFAAFTPLKIPVTWWSAVLAVVLADFIYYCAHRLEHRVRFLWAFHLVHHSSKELNLTTSVRLPVPFFGETLYAILYIPAVLLGFPPALMVFAKIVVLTYQYWVHTEVVGKLGVLDGIFVTPSNHRVHHATNPVYLDKNLGGILILWDRLFGTYQPERDDVKIVYGLTNPIDSYNPLYINLYGPLQLAKDAFKWKTKFSPKY